MDEPETSERIDIDDTKETVHTFLDKIAFAKANGETRIETSEDIFRHYFPRGYDKDYFHFQGIEVVRKGKLEKVEAEKKMPTNQKLHPNDGAFVNR